MQWIGSLKGEFNGFAHMVRNNAVLEVKSDTIDFKVDMYDGIADAGVARVSFSGEQLKDK